MVHIRESGPNDLRSLSCSNEGKLQAGVLRGREYALRIWAIPFQDFDKPRTYTNVLDIEHVGIAYSARPFSAQHRKGPVL